MWKQYYCLFSEGVDADESRKNDKVKEGSGLSQRKWIDLKMETTHSSLHLMK